MPLVIFIQARLGSTRLPRKVCAELGGTTMIQQVYRRACKILPDAVVAVLVPWGEAQTIWSGGPLIEGPEEPLARYAAAAKGYSAETWVVRITGDCPLLDPGICREVLVHAGRSSSKSAWTQSELDGLDTEVFSAASYMDAHQQAQDPGDREHVTPWLRRRDDPARKYSMPHRLRWSVNTQEDLEFVRAVYAACSYCATAVPHHTNAKASIGGTDRSLVIDLHQVPDGGLVECQAADILQTRMEAL